jgi:nitrite reductase (cytochrome c-552)
MNLDHLIVDRSYGGRFQLKDWTYITDSKAVLTNMWELVLKDADPANSDQKIFLPGTATAANPVCMNCKSFDNILKWKYMGDPDPRAKWSRVSQTGRICPRRQPCAELLHVPRPALVGATRRA